jgi:exodeoxyribonuclease VII small subunit
MSDIPQDIQNLSFEQAYSQLEETVQKLEGGDLSLAEVMSMYERGMALAQQCGVQLDQAELTIKKLTPAGELEPFDDI